MRARVGFSLATVTVARVITMQQRSSPDASPLSTSGSRLATLFTAHLLPRIAAPFAALADADADSAPSAVTHSRALHTAARQPRGQVMAVGRYAGVSLCTSGAPHARTVLTLDLKLPESKRPWAVQIDAWPDAVLTPQQYCVRNEPARPNDERLSQGLRTPVALCYGRDLALRNEDFCAGAPSNHAELYTLVCALARASERVLVYGRAYRHADGSDGIDGVSMAARPESGALGCDGAIGFYSAQPSKGCASRIEWLFIKNAAQSL